MRGAERAFRIAADTEPDRQLRLRRSRRDRGIRQRRAETALPRHPLGGVEREKEVELLGEKRVVIGEAVAEQWEGFDEGAAAGDQLGAPIGDEVDGGEI